METKTKILVATDGSEFSKAALVEVCKIFGGSNKAAIKVMAVREVPAPVATEPFVSASGYYQEVADQLQEFAKNSIADAAGTLREGCPKAEIIEEPVGIGRPVEVILDVAAAWGADMIVVGSHGYGFWERALLGSVSQAVVHHAKCSVLVVRKP